ncbi:HEAT repeat domain-containing protein [Chamaesiphon minutus]|uniref:HEAT repeat-containing protein n=1 Tax=Chamaesiphon minutus (strain ATCC 27169 / PCC 6605) TaxID=1173020 RepID=K9UN71_CHAP6|nr:hypothetical protein [Chamaesiphon minutus]AFY96552.1 hypothetical protein Cha6605_5695 [Chamaesiphon minutus PCC 6605]
MDTYPALTISLLSQLTNRELQSNYLNHLDRTAEVASLLTHITDPDLALRIVNLALEVDLNLGASLTSSLAPELQKIVVDGIERLEIPTRLKINLWRETKSNAALPYLQEIFIFNHQFPNTYEGHQEIDSAIATIIHIDRDLAVYLLIEELNHPQRYDRAAEMIVDLAPVEAIEVLGDLLRSGDLRNCNTEGNSIEALAKIGTEASISELREVLYTCKHRWSDSEWIQGLGYIADPVMVEHLIDLFYETDRPRSEVIAALEHIGGEKVFDWLHQSIYWVSADDEFDSPFDKIVQALFRLDGDRTLTAIEGAIHSYDPVVRRRAAMALVVWDVPIVDRNLSILLSVIDDPDLDVQIKITCGIREIIYLSTSIYNPINITPQLIDRAILAIQPIIKYINDLDPENRDRVIGQLSEREAYQWQIIEENKEPDDLPTLLTLLDDPDVEIRVSAVVSLIELGSVAVFPIVLKLASNPELVATLIWELKQCHQLGTSEEILNEFYHDREVTMKFLETAESSLIEAIANNVGHLCPNIFRLSEIGSDRAIPTLQKIIKSDAFAYYDEPEDATRSLATIGTDAAKMAILEILTDCPNLGRSVFNIFSDDGRLGLMPQLWSAHRQTYVECALDAISKIQEKEGLYNPDFSDRSHPLFEPPRRRLRDILLGNTTSEI